MKIFCDYCGKTADIAPDELADWLVLDPQSGAQMVMCASCESGPTPRAADTACAYDHAKLALEGHSTCPECGAIPPCR